MLIFRIFSRGYRKHLLSDADMLDFVCTFTKPKSAKKLKKYSEMKEYNKGDKYSEAKEYIKNTNLFCEHVSDRLGDNIKHFYKYIYPKRK